VGIEEGVVPPTYHLFFSYKHIRVLYTFLVIRYRSRAGLSPHYLLFDDIFTSPQPTVLFYTMLNIFFLSTVLFAASTLAYPQPVPENSSHGLTHKHLSPQGRKAGLSGYIGIQSTPAFAQLAPQLSWYSDYTPNTPSSHGLKGVSMLWGASGSSCGSVVDDRLATFKKMVKKGNVPDIVFGFYEPDCSCPSSSDMTVAEGAADWNALLAPLAKNHGTILGSPSMCKQYDEDYLTPFKAQISRPWDVTAVHINKPNLAEAKKDIEYYVQKYKKPIWVAEFACVHDQPSWQPCTDQGEIDTFIRDVVKYFEGNKHVVAYGPSNGEGLGDVWPLTKDGKLTASGKTYLAAVKGL